MSIMRMRMQVILNALFARRGSAHTGGGKKGESSDWINADLDQAFLPSVISSFFTQNKGVDESRNRNQSHWRNRLRYLQSDLH